MVSENVQMKWSKILKEGDHFSFLKQHKYIDRDGLWLHPDEKYAKRMTTMLGLEAKSKIAHVPISTPRRPTDEKKPLKASQKPVYKSLVCRARYLRGQQSDIGFAVKELTHGLKEPIEADWERLKQTARYLLGPQKALFFPSQGQENVIKLYSIVIGPETRLTENPLPEHARW